MLSSQQEVNMFLKRRENRKAVIDKVAAGLILQGYLDWLRTAKADALQKENE